MQTIGALTAALKRLSERFEKFLPRSIDTRERKDVDEDRGIRKSKWAHNDEVSEELLFVLENGGTVPSGSGHDDLRQKFATNWCECLTT